MKKRTKKTLSISGKVILRLVLATVLCAIVYLSMMTIGIGMNAFSHVVGYQLYEEKDNGEIVCIEKHTYKDGEKHLTKADIADNQTLTETRDFLPNVKPVFQIVSQIMMLIILAIFPYHVLWEFGNRDDTNVRYKGQRLDPYRGLRVGAFAMVPYAILWVLLVIAKYGILPEGYAQVYRLATIPFMPYVQWVMPSALPNTTLGQLLLLLPMLLYIPLVCGISYRLGHNQFSIREHLVFAKKDKQTDEEI